MIVRIFDTNIDPADVDAGKELFRTQVKPAFDLFEGCAGIEMHIGIDEHSGDLVDVVAISRWESLEAIDQATATDQYTEALAEIRKLFQRTPIVRHFEVI
jgi:quinol monooxygenase YgiN